MQTHAHVGKQVKEGEGLWYEAIVPTNIALIKYWGKRDSVLQWPANDSLSLTLGGLATTTKAQLAPEANDHLIFLQGVCLERGQAVADKAFRLLDQLAAYAPTAAPLRIETQNNFPMGCGIASSASGLGALALAAIAAWTGAGSWDELAAAGWPRERLALLARLGSGSACRSFWGGFVLWEAGDEPEGQKVGPLGGRRDDANTESEEAYWPLADTVVLFSEEPKKVSSSQGHQAAWSSPLFAPRLAGMPERLSQAKAAVHTRDLAALGPLLEQEALEMHAVMMSAAPAVHYFGQETAAFLAWLRRIRQQEGLALYFTLDAGANVHVIGEEKAHAQLHELLARDFPSQRYLFAPCGHGPSVRVCSALQPETELEKGGLS